jgi:hypothetical protein
MRWCEWGRRIRRPERRARLFTARCPCPSRVLAGCAAQTTPSCVQRCSSPCLPRRLRVRWEPVRSQQRQHGARRAQAEDLTPFSEHRMALVNVWAVILCTVLFLTVAIGSCGPHSTHAGSTRRRPRAPPVTGVHRARRAGTPCSATTCRPTCSWTSRSATSARWCRPRARPRSARRFRAPALRDAGPRAP